jgi:hypothetical protein
VRGGSSNAKEAKEGALSTLQNLHVKILQYLHHNIDRQSFSNALHSPTQKVIHSRFCDKNKQDPLTKKESYPIELRTCSLEMVLGTFPDALFAFLLCIDI